MTPRTNSLDKSKQPSYISGHCKPRIRIVSCDSVNDSGPHMI